MPADIFHFEDTQRCEQGVTFDRVFPQYEGLTQAELYALASGTMTAEQEASVNSKRVDMTGYTARMQVRETIESASFAIELTTENGRILIDEALGEVNLLISAADTSSLTAGSYVYDLELVSGSRVTRLIQGRFVVDRGTTR
jgi:hypothetical protein